MTDSGPFAPPPGAFTPRPAEPAPAPPAGAPLAPPTGAPIVATPPGYPVGPPIVPPPPPRRRWILPVVLGGSVAVLALLAGVVFVAVQFAGLAGRDPFTGTLDDGSSEMPSQPEDLLTGEPGTSVAVEPLDCDGCFSVVEARALGLPDESYAAIGLPVGDNLPGETLAGTDHADQSKWWKVDGGTPDTCFFTYTRAPLFFEPGAEVDSAAASDAVIYSEWYSDDLQYYAAGEAVRVFDDSAGAVAHLAELEAAVLGCPDYSYPDSGWASRVTPAPAFDLPPSVAAYGWVESSGTGRFYAVDVQRGNLVTRITLWSDGDGPTEADFRGLVEEYAVLLAELDPEA